LDRQHVAQAASSGGSHAPTATRHQPASRDTFAATAKV
jgi:hypothetical protein